MRGWSEGTGAKQGRDRGAGGDRKACIRDYSRAYDGDRHTHVSTGGAKRRVYATSTQKRELQSEGARERWARTEGFTWPVGVGGQDRYGRGGGGWMLTLSRSWCTACQQFRHPWPRHPPGTSGPGRGTEQEPGKPGNHRRGSKKPPQQVAACDGRLGLGAAVTKGLRHSARMAGRERCGRDWDVTAARQRPPRRRGQTRGQAHVGETVIRLVRYDRSAPGSQGASRHRRT